jgi:hypothetical protein
MRASAGENSYCRGLFFVGHSRAMSVLSANAIRSSLNFISGLFVHFLYALAWEEKYRCAQPHCLRGVSAVVDSAEFSMRSWKRISAMQNATFGV